jgi:hypothetical protein
LRKNAHKLSRAIQDAGGSHVSFAKITRRFVSGHLFGYRIDLNSRADKIGNVHGGS